LTGLRLPIGVLREALLMNRLSIGECGLYEWNCRYEYAPLTEAGYVLR
jgi:hypothetical protein